MSAVEEWNFVQVQEIASKAKYSFMDGDWIEAPYITNEGIRLIQTGNIGIGMFVDKNKKFISETSFQKLKCKDVYTGDILICRLADPIGRSCVVPDLQSRSITSVDVCILRINDDAFDRDFVAHALNQKDFLDACQKQAAGSTRQRISRTNLGKLKLRVPKSKLEQTKIAEVLSTVDLAIEQIDALIAKQQRIKTGLMQDLFSQGIDEHGNRRSEETHQFKDSPLGRIPLEWETATIGELAIHVGSGITPRGGESVYTNEGILFIRSQNVHFSGLALDDVAYIPQTIHKSMLKSEVFENDVLLNITGASIGRCCYFSSIGSANVNQHVCVIRLPSATEADAGFLSSVIESSIGQNQILQFNAGGNREGLNYKQIKSFVVPWPKRDERRQIWDVLKWASESVRYSEKMKSKLCSLKTALMQDLLTGKKCVAVFLNEKEVANV
ncbi:restriction endonuclease subunit S [Methanosarcina mazei]|uniref:Type I restriction modification DNA specificity domain-containing protein n=1 Tax=Methanosarcina mazei TaxID=2209 RepID=A0A0F8LYR5_METMZ|nr:restriction endonuclease subunit S [Methanosarcina mazei]KKG73970.1 hypothetical protein DU46_09445 [Methanosarcina mazei]KKG82062.1 hypothetical protein DU55_05265 [Methanosarcina mazei]KKG85060.1 hypothetical protein DU61_10900 [Methanosarcina mazei]KKG97633.1 hypothetical protein DU66_08665 [Methanosarcina mazei]KKG98410.1 hypothetical protein DU68_08190 [Methanosarcina mazei]